MFVSNPMSVKTVMGSINLESHDREFPHSSNLIFVNVFLCITMFTKTINHYIIMHYKVYQDIVTDSCHISFTFCALLFQVVSNFVFSKKTVTRDSFKLCTHLLKDSYKFHIIIRK